MNASFLRTIDNSIAERTLLRHPFYEAWSAGTLSLDALAFYAKEYFCVVEAVPEMVHRLSIQSLKYCEALKKNEEEERAHIPLWLGFSRGLGLPDETIRAHRPTQKTQEAVQSLLSLTTTFAGGAAAMYAFEKEIPTISLTKREGLKTFYGIVTPAAVEYFTTHAEADVRHARVWRGILAKEEVLEQDIACAVDASLDAQHKVLDACYEGYC